MVHRSLLPTEPLTAPVVLPNPAWKVRWVLVIIAPADGAIRTSLESLASFEAGTGA
jgi:hypothetical protein